jgi:hypothetical protein
VTDSLLHFGGKFDPIAKDILAIHNRTRGLRERPIRWGGNQLGNVRVEDAYVYPLPAAVST